MSAPEKIRTITSLPIGKYAQMRLRHLQTHLPEELARLKEAGELEPHLAAIQKRTTTEVERLIRQYLETHPYRDPNSWEERVQAESMAKLLAEEAVLPQLVLTPSEIIEEE